MDNISYLHMSQRKRLKYSYKIMNKTSSTDSNISLDSLENSSKWKAKIKTKPSEDKVDTILVPFYENDVLIKVPKTQKQNTNKATKSNKVKKELNQTNSYLVKKDKPNSKRPTYLEIFRKQLTPNERNKNSDKNEIRSLSPEFGDTERESIEDDVNNPATEFFNTEAYNEMYYDKLLNRDIQTYMENSLEDSVLLHDNLNLESPTTIRDESPDNFRSVSEVSNRRRMPKRAVIERPPNLKLGGLGPDMENIRPRLERARSLQRYSEKVRMENRLKIYKNTIACNEKKVEKVSSAKNRSSGKELTDDQGKTAATYLMNKTTKDNQAKVKSVYQKSKSADSHRTRIRNAEKERTKERSATRRNENDTDKRQLKNKAEDKVDTGRRNSAKANSKINAANSVSINKCINTEGADAGPVQISFIVNVGGIRPSSALKTLEQKHRMYQEQVKEFMDNNDG